VSAFIDRGQTIALAGVSEHGPQGGSLARSVKSGVAWSTLTFGLTKGLAFLSMLVLARLLAPSQFGVVAALTVVLGVIELIADLGMKSSVIYEQEQGAGERVQVAFTVNMLLVVALTAAAFIAAPALASFFHASGHVGLFRLAALDIFITGLGQVHDGLLLRDLRFRARIVTQVVSAIVRAVVGVTLALLGFGAASLVWGLVAGTAAWTVALWVATGFLPTFHFRRAVARSILGYGVAASVMELVDQLTIQVDTTVVGRVLGTSALGLYSVGTRIPSMALENIANQVSLVAFPALARKRVLDAEGVAGSTLRLVRYESLYALPLAAGLAVMARPIVETVFSAKWLDATGVFAAVAVMSGISASGFALGDAFKALGRQRVMVALNIIEFPVIVVAILIAAPYGITTVAWVRAGMELLWVTMMTLSAVWVVGIPARRTLVAMWPGMAAAVGVVLATGPVRLWVPIPTVPKVIAGAIAGAVGGLAALAVLSPATFAELQAAAAGIRKRARSDGEEGDSLPALIEPSPHGEGVTAPRQ